MSEAVCVTVEQLKRLYDSTGCCATDCYSDKGEDCTCGYVAIGNAIAQAERLKGWQPKVGDRVRLKAMPEVRGVVLASGKPQVQVLWDESSLHLGEWRYLAELMPAEE